MQTVVVADGNPITRKLVMMTLGDEQFRYVEADSAESAIKLILSEQPAIVIVSSELGSKSGIDIAKTIKKIYGLANISFILLFDDSKPKDSVLAEAGIDGAVPKKLLTRFLKEDVKRILDKRSEGTKSDFVFRISRVEEPLVHRERLVNSQPQTPHTTEPKAQPTIKTEPYYPRDSVKAGNTTKVGYFDPVKAFMEDEVEIVQPYKRVDVPAREIEQKTTSRIVEINAPPKAQPQIQTSNSGALSDAQISLAVREAVLEVIKEIVPIFKEKLVSALEKRLKFK